MEPTVPKSATEKSAASARKDRRLRAVYRRALQNSVYYWAIAASVGASISLVIGVCFDPPAGFFVAATPERILPECGTSVLSIPQSINPTPPSAVRTFTLTLSPRPLPFATHWS